MSGLSVLVDKYSSNPNALPFILTKSTANLQYFCIFNLYWLIIRQGIRKDAKYAN